ncbi:MAG TPA: hypothetical protein VK926_06850 [Gaiellaceae bacterium]|nr:hypothetical protein [Gaiellaceae bacterium]
MAVVDHVRPRISRHELVSPELVLVDPGLAEHARALLADPEEVVAPAVRLVPDPSRSSPAAEAPLSPSSDAAEAAIRRISESSLEAELLGSARSPSRRGRRLVGSLALLASTCALAAFLADRQVVRGEPPEVVAGAETPDVSASAVAGHAAARPAVPDESPTSQPSQPAAYVERPLTVAGADRAPSASGGEASSASARAAARSSHSTTWPSPSPSAQPSISGWAPAGRRFVWRAAEGASGYHVELFRGRERVFVTDTSRP